MTELLLNKLTIKTVNELWYAEEVVWLNKQSWNKPLRS
jgi:hypothetical protein